MRQVVVTGGGTGIGKGVAAALANLGDEVVIAGRRKDVLEETAAQLGANVRYVVLDATDPAQIEAALDTLPERVDVLVNSAGGNTDIGVAAPSDLAELAANGRAGSPADIAGAVVFLASPAASHVTGQVLHVNGGALGGR